jgi:hypothetical protein
MEQIYEYETKVEKQKKILICCPVASLKQYSFRIWLTFLAKQSYSNFDYAVCCNGKDKNKLINLMKKVSINWNKKIKKDLIVLDLPNDEKLNIIERITFSREILRRYAIKKKYEGLLWLDSDTIPVNLNSVEMLVNSNKDAISGVYFYKNSKVPILLDKKTGTNIKLDIIKDNFEDKKLFEILCCGYGCMYHSRKTMEIPFDFNKMDITKNDDFGHCLLISENKIKIYCNPLVFCKHIRNNKQKNSTKISNKLIGGNLVKRE